MEREYPSLEGNRHSGDEVTGSGRILAWMSLEVIGRGEHPLLPPSHFLYVPRVRDTVEQGKRGLSSSNDSRFYAFTDGFLTHRYRYLLRYPASSSDFIPFSNRDSLFPTEFSWEWAFFLEGVDECFLLLLFFSCNFTLRIEKYSFSRYNFIIRLIVFHPIERESCSFY